MRAELLRAECQRSTREELMRAECQRSSRAELMRAECQRSTWAELMRLPDRRRMRAEASGRGSDRHPDTPRGGVRREINLGHDTDTAQPGELNDALDVSGGVALLGRPCAEAETWRRLEHQRERLAVDDVPVEHGHLGEGHGLEGALDRGHGQKVCAKSTVSVTAGSAGKRRRYHSTDSRLAVSIMRPLQGNLGASSIAQGTLSIT